MRADEFLKKHAGTPHDWEDWERYQAEEKAKAAQSKAELNKKADD
mgnify:CR=1 FL=1